MNRSDLAARLEQVVPTDELADSKEQELLTDLLKHPGLPLLWALMLGQKQAQFVQLQVSPLTNMETISRAARIQGTIFGIDQFYHTLLEQAVNDEQEQTSNGNETE